LGCCWSAVFLLRTAGKQQQSSKPIRMWKESGIGPIDHFMLKKIIEELKNVIQSLCTHSAFSLFDNPIFVIKRGLSVKETIGCEK
jgi:glucose-6-phosphate 1-dehydrogenase